MFPISRHPVTSMSIVIYMAKSQIFAANAEKNNSLPDRLLNVSYPQTLYAIIDVGKEEMAKELYHILSHCCFPEKKKRMRSA